MAEPLKDQAEQKLDDLADHNVDSTDSDLRYMAYAFRPVVHPAVVTAAYGVSWLYLTGDVGYETYKAHRRGPSALEAATFSEPTRLSMVAVKRAVFQSVASMALPAFTIHTAVKQAKKAFVNVQNPRLKTWGPTVTGLAIVPVLPYLFDKPVEHVTDVAFEWIEKQIARSQSEGKGKSEL